MLSIILFTSVLAGLVTAQNSSSNFDLNQVPLSTRNGWCNGERNNCPKLCGGQAFIKENTCFGNTLTYACTCTNGTEPPQIAEYLDTLPNYICQETFKNCNENTPGSSECKECGKLAVNDLPSSTTSSAAAATTSGTETAAGTESPAPTSSDNAAPSLHSGPASGLYIWAWAIMAAGVLAGAILL